MVKFERGDRVLIKRASTWFVGAVTDAFPTSHFLWVRKDGSGTDEYILSKTEAILVPPNSTPDQVQALISIVTSKGTT